MIFWPGASRRQYRLEYKDDLGAATWIRYSEFGVDYTWPFPPHRFYRVVLLPESP